MQLLPTANPGGSCKKGGATDPTEVGCSNRGSGARAFGYRHTVTQERDPTMTPPVMRRRRIGASPASKEVEKDDNWGGKPYRANQIQGRGSGLLPLRGYRLAFGSKIIPFSLRLVIAFTPAFLLILLGISDRPAQCWQLPSRQFLRPCQ